MHSRGPGACALATILRPSGTKNGLLCLHRRQRLPAGSDVETAGEARVVGEETLEHLRLAILELVDGDVGSAAAAGPGDDLGLAVAVGVAGAHADAAGEGGVVGEEAQEPGQVLAAEDGDI